MPNAVVRFDGNVTAIAHEFLWPQQQAATVEFWFKPSSGQVNRILFHMGSVADRFLVWSEISGSFRVEAGLYDKEFLIYPASADTWHHLAGSTSRPLQCST